MKKTIILAVFITIMLPTSVFAITFKDVEQNSWYSQAVDELTSQNIINGYPDKTFKPNKNVRVDEFIKMVITAKGYILENDEEYWANNYIDKAMEIGIIYENEFYDYTRNISRAEMTRMVMRCIKYDSTSYTKYEKNIQDLNEIDNKYLDYVLKGYEIGIVAGIGNSFKPDNFSTRKEATVMIHRLISPENRVENIPEGVINKVITVKDLKDEFKSKGYTTSLNLENINDNTVTRELYGYILYNYVFDNKELKDKLIPKEEIFIPYATRVETGALQGTIKTSLYENLLIWQPYGGRGIDLKVKLCFRDFVRKYEDGRENRVIIYNPFLASNETIKEKYSEYGLLEFHEIANSEPKLLPYDYQRFEILFSDSNKVDDLYKKEFFKLYEYGIFNYHTFDSFAIKMYASPNSRITYNDIDEFWKIVDNPSNIDIIDENSYGKGDILLDNKFGIEPSELKSPMKLRTPYVTAIYNYDNAEKFNFKSTLLEFSKEGLTYQFLTEKSPYFSLYMHMQDVAYEDKTSSRTTYFYNDLLENMYKDLLTYMIPKGYKEEFLRDLYERFVDKSDEFYKYYVLDERYGNVQIRLGKLFIDNNIKYSLAITYTN